MPASRLFVVDKNAAIFHCPRLVAKGVRVVYFCNDFAHELDLKKACGGSSLLAADPELFHRTVDEIRRPYLDLVARINRLNNTLAWWGGHLASKNPASNPLFVDLVRLFAVLRLLEETKGPVAVVLQNSAVIAAVRNEAVRRGCAVEVIASPLAQFRDRVQQGFRAFLRLGYFVFLAAKLFAISRVCRSELREAGRSRRILLRSWILEASFDKDGRYKDRLFADFPKWLESRGYEVWHYPFLFPDVALVSAHLFDLMQGSGERWLLPQRYLRLSDYASSIANSWRLVRTNFAGVIGVVLCGVDVRTLFEDANRNQLFAFDLMIANFGHAMLKRLRERGVEFERIIYSFEGNPHEKTFLLGCREYYPGVPVDAYHPTALFSDDHAYYLGEGDAAVHPLPDRLLCGGPIYLDAFAETGFPRDRLTLVPSLRTHLQPLPCRSTRREEAGVTRVFIPLSGVDRHQTVELLYKTMRALQPADRYRIHIRPHPVFTRREIEDMLAAGGIANYAFADDGAMQDWLARSDLMVAPGFTMASIEGVAMGLPVVRLRPANNLYYDAIAWTDYPLPPVNTVEAFVQVVEKIAALRAADPDCFIRLAETARRDYFEPVSESGLMRFLEK